MAEVIIIHGWNPDGHVSQAEAAIYDTLVASLQQAGHTASWPRLPANGNKAGDSITNAQFIKGLGFGTILIGHSLGGMVAEYYMRLLNTGSVIRYVTLDASVHNPTGARFFSCWFGPPDQCDGSAVRNAIKASPYPPQPILNIWATHSQQATFTRPTDYTNLHVNGTHAGMVNNPETVAAILDFIARGG